MPFISFDLNLEEGAFVRQISATDNKMLITDSKQNLYEYTTKLVKLENQKIRSAVYNATGNEIIALLNRKDKGFSEPHITIIKSIENFNEKNEIKFDFPNEIKRNEFQAYYITDYEGGTFFVYSAFYTSDGEREDNLGTPLVFAINSDLNMRTKFNDLKSG